MKDGNGSADPLLAHARRLVATHGRVTRSMLRADGARGDNATLNTAAKTAMKEHEALQREHRAEIAAAGLDPASPEGSLGLLPGPLRESIMQVVAVAVATVAQVRNDMRAESDILRGAMEQEHSGRMAEQRTALHSLQEEHALLAGHAATLEQQLRSARAEAESLRVARADQDARQDRLLEEHRVERAALREELRGQHEANDSARDRQNLLEGELRELREAIARSQRAHASTTARADALETDLTAVRTEHLAVVKERDTACEEVQRVNTELAAARADLETAIMDRDAVQGMLLAAREELRHLRTRLATETALAKELGGVAAIIAEVRNAMVKPGRPKKSSKRTPIGPPA